MDIAATLKRNSGTPEPFVNGQKIEEDGSYQLVVTKVYEGGVVDTTINFTMNSIAESAIIVTNLQIEGSGLTIRYSKVIYENPAKAAVMAIWEEDVSGNFVQFVSRLAR